MSNKTDLLKIIGPFFFFSPTCFPFIIFLILILFFLVEPHAWHEGF